MGKGNEVQARIEVQGTSSRDDALVAASSAAQRFALAFERFEEETPIVVAPESERPTICREAPESTADSSISFADISIEPAADEPAETLANLGMSVSEWLKRGHGSSIVVALDTIPALETADPATIFSFLHLMQARTESVDGRLVCTIDADRHDRSELRTFGMVFDEVELVDGNDWDEHQAAASG